MGFSEFASAVRSATRTDGVTAGARTAGHHLLQAGLRRADAAGFRRGPSPLTRDWELLVVLDGCRVDLLSGVADEYDVLTTVETARSPASMSETWLDRSFSHPDAGRTAYVTANPYSKRAVSAGDLAHLDEVWRDGWDEEAGTVRAETVTDRAIDLWRRHRPDRLVVHYMQPHYPFVPNPIGTGIDADRIGETDDRTAWELLRDGVVSRDRVWDAYEANLRYVLDEAAPLFRSVDADPAVVTADHGNAIGEWGFYGHPRGVPLSVLRTVPWVVTSAADDGEYEPSVTRAETDDATTDRLRALGYTE